MTFRTTVERLGHLGDGIAPGPLFVPGALPGEIVTGRPEGDRLREVKILTPSAARVRPPCRHYGACGGCALQHASEAFLADWKVQVVRNALAAQGLEAEVRMLSVSPPASRRRAGLSGRRTRGGAIVGFHDRASDTITEIADCRLLHPGLTAALPALRELTLAGASRRAEIALHATLSESGIDVAVRGGREADARLRQSLAELAERHDLARLSWEGQILAARRPPWQRMGRARVVPPPGAFLQATEEGAAALVRAVLALCRHAGRVADLFSGCGTFALPLAGICPVHAVESDAGMLEALEAGWRQAPGLKRLTTERRDLFRRPLTADELSRFDTVVLDPPRAGARAQVEQIAAAPLRQVVSVSCNPASFARDAKRLVAAGFALGLVGVVDQFLWSPHVELVAGLHRPAGGAPPRRGQGRAAAKRE